MKCGNNPHRAAIKLKQNKAFTLVEVLLAVAIIAILIAVAIPADTDSLERGRVTADAANERAAQAAAIVEYMKTGNFGGVPVSDTAIGYYDEAAEKWSDSYVGIASYGECTKLLKHKDNFLRGTMTVVDGVPYLTLSWTNQGIEENGGDAEFRLCSGDKSPEPPTLSSGETETKTESESESKSESESPIASTPTARGWLWGTIPDDIGIANKITDTNKICSDTGWVSRSDVGFLHANMEDEADIKFECWEVNGYAGQTVEVITNNKDIYAPDQLVWAEYLYYDEQNDIMTPDGGNFLYNGSVYMWIKQEESRANQKVRYIYKNYDASIPPILCLHYNAQKADYVIATDKMVLKVGQDGIVEGGPRLEGGFEGGHEYYKSVAEADSGARTRAYPTGVVNVECLGVSENSGKISWKIAPIAPGTAMVECVYTFDLPFNNAPRAVQKLPYLVPDNNIKFTVTIKTEVEVVP